MYKLSKKQRFYKEHPFRLIIYTGLIICPLLIMYYINEYYYSTYDIIQNNTFIDGEYSGESQGYQFMDTKVKITIKNNEISEIILLECGCTPNESDGKHVAASHKILNEIITKQSTGIDGISGSTRSTTGITKAVIDALEKAQTK